MSMNLKLLHPNSDRSLPLALAAFRGARSVLCVCFSLFIFSSAALAVPDRVIFPIPRIGTYQTTIVSSGSAMTLIPDTAFDAAKIQRMSNDVSAYVTERYGRPFTLNVDTPDSGVKIFLLKTGNVISSLGRILFTDPYLPSSFPAGLRGDQGFIIRSFLTGYTPKVYIVSNTEQGANYGLYALAQLIRWEDNNFTLRGVDLIDWPAFEVRMSGDLNKYAQQGLSVDFQRNAIRFKAGIQRITHGSAGYADSTTDPDYAKDRWLRLSKGYWEHPSLQPPLAAYNWSDPSSIQGYVDLAASLAGGNQGCYMWHDATDAGWWHTYLDNFWANRDAVDLANYPTASYPTPAEADAVRFTGMLNAIENANTNVDVLLTVPCYYDNPQDNNLNRVGLFRQY